MPFIYGIGALIVSAFAWADYTDDPEAPTNFLGNESKGHWSPDPDSDHGWIWVENIPLTVGFSERGQSILNWFSFENQKQFIMQLSVLAVILYTKPWK